MAKEKRIKVTLVKSVIGSLPAQRRTVKALGLKKSVVVLNTMLVPLLWE